jgi:hypothetical protein
MRSLDVNDMTREAMNRPGSPVRIAARWTACGGDVVVVVEFMIDRVADLSTDFTSSESK